MLNQLMQIARAARAAPRERALTVLLKMGKLGEMWGS